MVNTAVPDVRVFSRTRPSVPVRIVIGAAAVTGPPRPGPARCPSPAGRRAHHQLAVRHGVAAFEHDGVRVLLEAATA